MYKFIGFGGWIAGQAKPFDVHHFYKDIKCPLQLPSRKCSLFPQKNILPNQQGCGELSSPGALPSNIRCGLFPESSMCRILICDVQSLMFNCAIVQAQFRDSQGEGRTQCWSLHGAPTTSRRSTRWINLKLRINLSHWRQIFRQI